MKQRSEFSNCGSEWRVCVMLESIVATCRAIASEPKLVMLYHLSTEDELPVTKLARRSRLGLSVASGHLRHLAAAGLVARRRAGRFVYCRLGAGGQRRGEFAPAGLLRRALGDPPWATTGWGSRQAVHLSARAGKAVPAEIARVLEVVFDAASALGNRRRLALLGCLLRRRQGATDAMAVELGMSCLACLRHLDKLRRRGYARERGAEVWVAAKRHKTPFHHALLALARPSLA